MKLFRQRPVLGITSCIRLSISRFGLAKRCHSVSSPPIPRFPADAREANQAKVELQGSIAERKQATRVQIALDWLLAQKPWVVPIPEITKLHRLRENVWDAAVELSVDDLRDVDRAAS